MQTVLIFINVKSVRQSTHLLCLNFFLLYQLFPFTRFNRFHFKKQLFWSIDNSEPHNNK